MRNLMLALLPLAAACAAGDDAATFAVVDDAPSVEVGAAAGEADLRGAMPFAIPTGSPVRYHWEGLIPGERMYLARADEVAAGPCFEVAGGLCLDIGPSVSLVGSGVADAGGEASVWMTVPDEFAGRDLVLQAVVIRGDGGIESFKGAPQVWQPVDALEVGEIEAGELRVTELMRDPAAVTDAEGEWFEVRNLADRPAMLNGLEIADADSDYFLFTGTVTILEPGEHIVFGKGTDMLLNGGLVVDITTTDITLANVADELRLMDGDRVIDEVVWDDSVPNHPGHALQLDESGAWCDAQEVYGDGDHGTPGALNPLCAD
ncbi:MAG: hypothetical protein ACI9K2_005558 [Myxococcota bacterium]|jgi:hypothetical protein